MPPVARWLVVAALALLVASPPVLARAWPIAEPDVDLSRLAERAARSDRLAWSGEVAAQGGLSLPVREGALDGLARLLGERTDLRVWWRDRDDWRVDRLRTTGETDNLRDGGLTVRWSYESGTARFNAWSAVRLPDDLDVLPSSLATRLLEDARPDELTALPARRVAGVTAAGLRLRPADARSSLRQVDVWADPRTGLPLRVAVYGDAPAPALTSEVTRLDQSRPPASRTSFSTGGADLDFVQGQSLDEAGSANAFAPFRLPDRVAGLARRGNPLSFGAVGAYGAGPAQLVALPLRDGIARDLGDEIARSAAARVTGRSTALDVGPVSVLLVQDREANFLLVGTVTPATLQTAASDLLAGTERTE